MPDFFFHPQYPNELEWFNIYIYMHKCVWINHPLTIHINSYQLYQLQACRKHPSTGCFFQWSIQPCQPHLSRSVQDYVPSIGMTRPSRWWPWSRWLPGWAASSWAGTFARWSRDDALKKRHDKKWGRKETDGLLGPWWGRMKSCELLWITRRLIDGLNVFSRLKRQMPSIGDVEMGENGY